MERTTVNRRYRIDRRIGEGGMAEVYLGHDLLLNRAVALKTMRPQYAADADFRARFEREAIAVAGLTHPNIVEIFDVGEEGGTPYFVMEFVQGDTLKTVVEQEGPFAPDDVAALLEQVGSALDYAHERGIVHRDVKPQNVLVTPDGMVKVLDFGIAKDIHDSHLTELGTGLGTVHYVSPEQANGLMATPSSDVYSLGVVAYEMLTGRLPFVAENPVAVALLHVHEPPRPPSTVFPPVPRQVDAIVLRALDKDPTRRYQTAGALAGAMTDWRNQRVAFTDPGESAIGWGAAPPPARAAEPVPSRALGSPPTWTPPPAPPGAGDGRSAGAGGASVPPRAVDRAPQPIPATRDDVGCTTWLVGVVVMVALVALVWTGFRLSPRLAGLGAGESPPPTVAAAGSAGAAGAAGPGPTQPAEPSTASISAPESTSPAAQNAKSVPVPNLIGKSIAEATSLVTSRGLEIEDDERVFSEEVPLDAVAEQDPPPDVMVQQGETVVVKLSRGSATIPLDDLDLVGVDAAAAEHRLAARGLGVERIDVGDPEVPQGHVVEVDPAASVTVGETVILYVSVGDMIQVPEEIRGRPLADIERQLDGLGFEIVETVPLDQAAIDAEGLDLDATGVDAGDVVRFSVEAGEADFDTWLERGTEITLVYYQPFPDSGQDDDGP